MPNTDKIFILGSSQLLIALEGSFIEVPNLINEVEIHNWVIELFRTNEIEKVVIEIGENALRSLQIGYHIRLSIEDIKRNALVPILYVSKLSLNSVMLQAEEYVQIIATKGIYFSEFDLKSIKTEIEFLKGLNESEYFNKFLKFIHIQPDETVGRHSLANIWGAHSMDIASNAYSLPSDSDFKKSLYFKYISAFNSLEKLKSSDTTTIDQNKDDIDIIEAKNKRILFIDDEADKGWETVLRKVFKTNKPDDFVVIKEKVKDYKSFTESSKKIIETEKFDLYLVDLRLNGLDEDDNIDTEAFSGMKVLNKIKTINGGNQLIIFTASNKSWNLKSLLDAGADGYYLKESPEYNFSKHFSKQNYCKFKLEAYSCFQMAFLRDVYTSLTKIEANFKVIFPNDVLLENEIISYLNISFNLLKETKQNPKYFNYAYIQLFLLIELFISNDSIFKEGDNAYVILENCEVLVQQRFTDKIEHAIKFISGKYELGKTTVQLKYTNEKSNRLDTNFKVSALLIFRYGHQNSSVKKWTNIYQNRNTKTAHYQKGDGINVQNISELIHFIEYLSDINNINKNNVEKGLKEKSYDKAINELLKLPFVKDERKGKK
jgi:CheY-like chemotaxis protein